MADPNWAAIRAEFPALRNWTFLNTATYGQLPRRATEAAARHFARRDELACADFLSWFDDADCIRESIARLIHCSADDIAFVQNAATALATLITGADWEPGGRIITLEGEFPNNLYYPAVLAARGLEFIETSWDRFYESIDERTRLVLLSTTNYTTGFRPPLAEIAKYVHDRGALLYLDGTQSVGAIRFDVADVKPDMLAVHGYKWLLSPNGSGFMYVSESLRRRLRPTVIGWRSDRRWREVSSLHHGAPEFVDSAEKYEGGMLNFPGVYAMGASVDLMLEIGPAEIEERVLALAAQCGDVLEQAGGEIAHRESHIIAARFPGRDAVELANALNEQRILVSARHGHLRVSVHFYNNEEDLERMRGVLRTQH